jgi:HD-GYP domain-containing protein (c-di-GMP phosphodiesterase class II)
MKNSGNAKYEKELFKRLKASASLKREEECIGSCLKSPLWWLIEHPNPTLGDLGRTIEGSCPHLKRSSTTRHKRCLGNLLKEIEKARRERSLVRFDCLEGLHGFVYPITQGERLYGYIGACYEKKDVPAEIMAIFAAFTDTIVKEIQKELELSKLYETIRPRAIALSTVHTVHRLISSTLDLNELLPRIARLSMQVMRANRCSIKLVDARRKTLLPKATIDLREKKSRLKKVRVGKWAPGKAVKYAKAIRGPDYLATPLIDEDVIGVITLYDKIDNKSFTQFDEEVMTTFAEQAVIAIKNAQLYKEQEKLTVGSIRSLATVLDARAKGVYAPRASFAKIAVAIGQRLRVENSDLKSLEYAAILHDAGQMIMPDEILTKPSKLTGKEYDKVKEHPLESVKMIRHMKALRSVVPIILYHHENYDGSGYPKGLKKDKIPLGARIMAVVGAFEAMITKRPYRVTRTVEEAVGEIRRNSGTQFDPKIVEVFLKVVRRRDIRSMLEREMVKSRRR